MNNDSIEERQFHCDLCGPQIILIKIDDQNCDWHVDIVAQWIGVVQHPHSTGYEWSLVVACVHSTFADKP